VTDQNLKKTKAPSTGNAVKILGLLARIVVGVVLIVSGAIKLSAPKEEFSMVIEAYGLVPPSMALTLAAFLPWIELLIGYSLISGYFLRVTAAAAGILFVVFDLALLSLRLRGIILPSCGCFGTSFHPSPNLMMGVDLALCAMSFLAFKSPQLLSLDHWAMSANQGEKLHDEQDFVSRRATTESHGKST
jgi:uncharacterized membrane protein YphA (DoxX/SURF4 family)